MKKMLLMSALLFFTFGCEKKEIEPAPPIFTGNKIDLEKFRVLNSCEGCDLSGVDLRDAKQ